MFALFRLPQRSISKEVSMGLILTIILVSTVSFYIAYKVARKKAHEHLNSKADEYILHLKDILIIPLWNYDYEIVDAIGETYLQNDHIEGITITDSRGNTCISVTKPDATLLVKRSAKLFHYGYPIGSVEISLTYSYYNIWNRQLFWYFGLIILINLLSLIIVTGFLLKCSLNKPLKLLNRIVRSYDAKKEISIKEYMPYSEFMPLLDTLEAMGNEITLRMSELRRLSTAVEQVADNIIITNVFGKIKYVNPAFVRSSGYNLEDIYNAEHRFFGADETDKKNYDKILQSVKDGQIWTGRITNKKKNNDLIIEDIIVSPIKSPFGSFMGYVSINRDVTLKAKFENQLRQSQKMEAIGALAGGIAHDFNNILGVIIGCSELARNSIPKDHRAVKDIEQVLTAGIRAKSLVNQILTFSRQEESKKIPLLLSPFIKEGVKFLKATLPKVIEIRAQLNMESGIVLADPIQMQQILMNLCTNSSQAIEQNRGGIDVTLSNIDYEKGDDLPLEITPGAYVILEVKDSGGGIPEEIIHKIFDPFFTTKGIGQGTGLGLSVVHGIVKKHGGAVTVKSIVGKGTTFQVILPRLEHADIEINVEQTIEPPGGNEKILLVDDEVALLDILKRLLSNLGYDVHAYSSSLKALKAFKEKPHYFDLVITDQLMPDMTGTDLAVEIKRLNSNIPVILFTGVNEKQSEQRDHEGVMFNRILGKPLRNADLLFALRKELDDKRKQS